MKIRGSDDDLLTFITLVFFPVYTSTVKPVYKGHPMEPENVPFMSSCPLYTGSNYMHYPLMGKMRLPFKARLTVLCQIFFYICFDISVTIYVDIS